MTTAPMARRPSILVVDDEVNITRTLQMVFEKEGYHVVPAYSAKEALAILENGHAPDAVVTDLNMERADVGLEVARFAKKLRSKPVVVICTGYANVQNSLAALTMHVDYLALKPVDLNELTVALNRLVRRRDLRKRS